MRAWLKQLDELLRGGQTGPQQLATGRLELPLRRFVPLAILLGASYGFFMGWYAVANRTPPNYMQVIASAVKLPALFLLTLVVTLPSLYVFNALVGCRMTFGATLRLLVGAVVVNLTVAASFATILGFFTLSTTSYAFMIVLNVVLLGVAGLVGAGFLLRTLRRLALWQQFSADTRTPAERGDSAAPQEAERRAGSALPDDSLGAAHAIFRIWVLIYCLVGAQMGWLLRPFIGSPKLEFTWFRPREGNFFQALGEHIRHLFLN